MTSLSAGIGMIRTLTTGIRFQDEGNSESVLRASDARGGGIGGNVGTVRAVFAQIQASLRDAGETFGTRRPVG